MLGDPNQPNISPSETADDNQLRSQFMQRLISTETDSDPADGLALPPRLIVQFWDDAHSIPSDVCECMASWKTLEDIGFELILFDDASALRFIEKQFGRDQTLAFERCRHPAMRADYFRLCFILKVGGLYVDADDVYLGQPLDPLLNDGRLKLQPLCYDITSDSMLDPSESAAIREGVDRIFYVNNNPLIAPPGHPIITSALARATSLVLSAEKTRRDIQSLTGPGNLTAAFVKHAAELERAGKKKDFMLMADWDSIAISKWPLSYRSDDRNWRNWERVIYTADKGRTGEGRQS